MRLLLPAALLTAFSAAAAAFGPAHAASFPCERARAPDERAICADRGLNDADVRVAVMFRFLRGVHAMGAAGNLGDSQRAWLAARQRCAADRACLRTAYARRERELQADYDALPRPF